MNSSCVFVDAVTETHNIDEEKSEIYPDLLELAKYYTKPHDLCFCGSGVKRNFCHG